MNRSVIVTGATGFLGGRVVRLLQEKGWSVTALGRDQGKGAQLIAEGIPFHSLDLVHDTGALLKLVKNHDAVVHCAALAKTWGPFGDFQQANVVGTQNLLDACQKAEVKRFVHISSTSVAFHFYDQRQLKENAAWAGSKVNPYITTKWEAEQKVLAQFPNAIVLRPHAIYGPGDTTIFPRVLRVAQRGFFPVFGDTDPWMDMTSVDHMAQAVIRALQAPDSCHGKVYSITDDQEIRRSELMNTLFDACGLRVRFVKIPVPLAMGIGSFLEKTSTILTGNRWEPPMTRYSVGTLTYDKTLDISAAKIDLGYAPRLSTVAGLQHFGKWWKENSNK
jgi:2-alkyl-3-oxoalkanoate reductase